MLYFSDHGESLGENNMYLHGAPWMIAPPEQTQVPFMLWMSDGFADRFHIDRTCLAARAGQHFSHDNVFHSVLGMLDVDTAVFNPRLDLFGRLQPWHLTACFPGARWRASAPSCLPRRWLIILWLGAFTNVDLALADALFDPGHGFRWRDAWLANTSATGIV
jgi:hypothetical protein